VHSLQHDSRNRCRISSRLVAVQASYEELLQALKSGDTTSLERIYADDYLLVRPNGDTLRKKEILADLRHHSMRFTSFEVNEVIIRTKGFVGILTAVVRFSGEKTASGFTGSSVQIKPPQTNSLQFPPRQS